MDGADQKVATAAEACVRLKGMLEKKFPGVSVDVLLMAHDLSVPFESPRVSRLADGILKVSFDCHCEDSQAPVYQPDIMKTAAMLSRYAAAVDYRTLAEKRRFRKVKRRAHWAKFGAKTFWGYLWAKLTGRWTK